MRKFFTLLIIIASCQKMAAIPIAEQYQKILAETSANAASETTAQIRDIRTTADSLKALPASKDNILAAEKNSIRVVLFALQKHIVPQNNQLHIILPPIAGKHNPRHQAGTIHIYRHTQPLWHVLRIVGSQRFKYRRI